MGVRRSKRSRIVAGGMLRENTPVQDYTKQYGLWVKREDLSCPKPGPPFSKTRGVYARVASRSEEMIGVLDTYHSQAGHAVARACQILGKKCWSFYPEYKNDPGWRQPQDRAKELGAKLIGLPAGRSCILFHAARKQTEAAGGYMMPNALKLGESVTETAKEVSGSYETVVIPISSGTIAAGVIRGFIDQGQDPLFVIHLGYSRSHDEVKRYLAKQVGSDKFRCLLVDEGFTYKDQAKGDVTPPWPCNPYYDLKAFQWCLNNRRDYSGSILFWNIG